MTACQIFIVWEVFGRPVILGADHISDHARAAGPAILSKLLPLPDERFPGLLFIRYAGLVAAASWIGRNVGTAALVEIQLRYIVCQRRTREQTEKCGNDQCASFSHAQPPNKECHNLRQ